MIPLRVIVPGRLVHILMGINYRRDADGEPYGVAVAYCAAQDDTTGSGRHGMVDDPMQSNCLDCQRAYAEVATLAAEDALDLDRVPAPLTLSDTERAGIMRDLGLPSPPWPKR